MQLSKSLIRADLIAAKQAMDYYDEKGIRDIKNIAAYHLQQAAEKMIKLQIYNAKVKVNNSQMYTHNIDRLISYAESLDISFIVPHYVRTHSAQISDWEAGSRYDVHFSARISTLKKTYSVLQDWEKKIR